MSEKQDPISELVLNQELKEGEKFLVHQFFSDGTNTNDGRWEDSNTAVIKAKRFVDSPAAKIGIVVRVIITDQLDSTVFDWGRDRGLTFPSPPPGEEPYGKWG